MGRNLAINKMAACLFMLLVMSVVTSCAMRGVTSDYQEKTEASYETVFSDITLEGGTGKAYIKSPVEIIKKDGGFSAKLIWSSENYDYMIVSGVRYENENPGGESTFTVTVDNLTDPLAVIADTVAMSVPHEIEYVITFAEPEKEKKATETEYTDKEPKASIETADEQALREQIKLSLKEDGLSLTETYDLKYAGGFDIERYGDLYLISIKGSGEYLLIPEGGKAPENLPEDTVILKQPLERTYLVSTSSMDLINACGALDMIKLSGTKESDWYVDEAKNAMESGKILYAGKYSAPDYELILENGCSLAIENTMIYHRPAVKEKLEELGIPVLVETSSYEDHPLGRLEWIKLYGVLFDREKEAEEFYDRQLEIIEPLLLENPDTKKTVAFFYVSANGVINTRRSGDYITEMIEISGGRFVPETSGDSSLSSVNMQMEDFYEGAYDADILIYSSTIGGQLGSLDELLGKNALFKDFKAVKESNVYCTKRDLFQKITGMADFIKDLNDIENGVEGEYKYLYRLR